MPNTERRSPKNTLHTERHIRIQCDEQKGIMKTTHNQVRITHGHRTGGIKKDSNSNNNNNDNDDDDDNKEYDL